MRVKLAEGLCRRVPAGELRGSKVEYCYFGRDLGESNVNEVMVAYACSESLLFCWLDPIQ